MSSPLAVDLLGFLRDWLIGFAVGAAAALALWFLGGFIGWVTSALGGLVGVVTALVVFGGLTWVSWLVYAALVR